MVGLHSTDVMGRNEEVELNRCQIAMANFMWQ